MPSSGSGVYKIPWNMNIVRIKDQSFSVTFVFFYLPFNIRLGENFNMVKIKLTEVKPKVRHTALCRNKYFEHGTFLCAAGFN